MREEEKYFQTMADTLPVMLWAAGADKRCTFFNRRWLDFTGCSLENELARGWTGAVHPADQARSTTAYERSFEKRQEFHAECRLRRADGEYRWMLASGAPQFPRGVFAGYVCTCADIGDVWLAHRQKLFRKKLETIGILASGIAHDFNNLLGSILADAEMALADLPAGCACGEDVERLRTVAIRASEIVRELMIYAGQEQAEMTAVDLSLLVEEMLGLLRVSIPKQARITTDLASNPPAVLAEAAELRQLVMNLVLNAADAVKVDGGEIHVATSRATIGRADAGPEAAPGDYVRLEVFDTGRGMPREVQARIFDPYFTTKRSGGGLGLTVVRRIVRRYNGAIRCESAAGAGTHFAVLLPCAASAERACRPAASAPVSIPQNLAGVTLLIVEDEESLRVPVSNMLRRKGLRVMEAADGLAAIQVLRDGGDAIDAMVVDLTLPGMSGAAVIAEAGRIRPDLKIVLTSAYSSQTAAAALASPQVKDFIRKPYEVRELMRVLGEVLAGAPTRSAPAAGIY